MPWCPNCKAEYQPGFTVCSDCKVELVDTIKEAVVLIPFLQVNDLKIAEKLVKFFNYSDLDSKMEYDETNDSYIVLIPPKQEVKAKKLYQAFYLVERDQLETEEASDSQSEAAYDTNSLDYEETNSEDEYQDVTPGDEINAFDEENQDSRAYVMKADQYKDLTGTVWVFLIFGIIGLVVVALNLTGILTIFNGWVPNAIMSVLFLFFIYVALSTNKKAKTVQAEIDAENKLTEGINEWLKQNITESFLASAHDESMTDELNYLRTIDTIKEMLIKEFGHQNLSYLDRLIEEFYNENF